MSNYAKGYRKEREVFNDLTTKGFSCIRSAGSHGAVDVLASCKDYILLIQVKYDCKADKKDIQALKDFKIPGTLAIRKEIWEFVSGNKRPKITGVE